MDIPTSTDGPSGPKEHPVPRVQTAATVLRKNANGPTRSCSVRRLLLEHPLLGTVPRNPGGKVPERPNRPTATPPRAGMRGTANGELASKDP
jgi:hypothetical protein